jgi:exopolysaccharide biosynthesis polyprenyl glycosylphosphotransferase
VPEVTPDDRPRAIPVHVDGLTRSRSGPRHASGQVPVLPPLHFGSATLLQLFRRLDFAVACVLFLLARTSGPAVNHAWYAQTLPLGHVLSAVAVAFGWREVAKLLGLYDARRIVSWRAELGRLAAAGLAGLVFAMALDMTLGPTLSPMRALHLTELALVTNVAVALARVAARKGLRVASARGSRRVLVIGTGPRAAACARTLQHEYWCHYRIIGFLDSNPQNATIDIAERMLGPFEALEDVLEHEVVDEVHIALPYKSCYAVAQRVIETCARLGVPVVYPVDPFIERPIVPVVESRMAAAGLSVRLQVVPPGVRLFLKRTIDVVLSGLALVLFSPLFLAIAVAVRLSGAGPIVFGQARWSQHRRHFRMYKFRSMRADAEAVLRANPELYARYVENNFKLSVDEDPRVTRIGRFLRKTSLDELPQLWNVFRGDMSIIGPRPIVPAEIRHYGPGASLLLALKPGLTGAWVVQGRNNVGYPHRAELELRYVRSWSLLRDAAIFLRTIPAVMRREGAH